MLQKQSLDTWTKLMTLIEIGKLTFRAITCPYSLAFEVVRHCAGLEGRTKSSYHLGLSPKIRRF